MLLLGVLQDCSPHSSEREHGGPPSILLLLLWGRREREERERGAWRQRDAFKQITTQPLACMVKEIKSAL
jgi:hypothetical protein